MMETVSKNEFVKTFYCKLLVICNSLAISWVLASKIVYFLEESYCAVLHTAEITVIIFSLLLTSLTILKKKHNLLKCKIVYTLIICVTCTYAFTIYVEPENNLIWGILFIFNSYLAYHTMSVKNDVRIYKASTILGFIFSTFLFLGFQLKTNECLQFLYIYDYYEDLCSEFGHYLFIFFGWVSFFTCFLIFFFTGISGLSIICPAEKPVFGRKLQIGEVFLNTMLIITCWILYYFVFYPGMISADSLAEIYAQLGMTKDGVIDASPVMHQLIIRFCMKTGIFLGSVNFGAGIYSSIQMIFLALSFSVSIFVLKEIGVKKSVRILILLAYALFPVNAFYSITMWKNVFFGASTVLLMAFLVYESFSDDCNQKGIPLILLVIASFLFSTFQKNGFAVYLIGFLLFIIFSKYTPSKRKKMIVVYVASIVLFAGYKYVIFNVMDVQKGKTGEALSVPIQQIARVVKIKGISDDCKQEFTVLKEVFPDVEHLGEKYKSYISDPVKVEGVFLSDVFDKNPGRYLKCWLKIGINNPKIYLDAFLLQNYGYWYPDVQYWIVIDTIDRNPLGLMFNDNTISFRHSLYKLFVEYSQNRPTSVLFSLGGTVWCNIIMAVLLILKRQKKYVAPMLIILVMWVTTLGAPVFCEYRYLYGLVICTPFFAGLSISVIEQKVNERET